MEVVAILKRIDLETYFYEFQDPLTDERVVFNVKHIDSTRKTLFFLIEHLMQTCLNRKVTHLTVHSYISTYRRLLTCLESQKSVHQNKIQTILSLKNQFCSYRYQFQQGERKKKHLKEFISYPPSYDYIAYCDVSYFSEINQSSISAVLYSVNGEEVTKDAELLPYEKNTTILESKALLKTMQIAKEKNLHNILFRFDNNSLFSIIHSQKKKYRKKKYRHLNDIRILLENETNWKIEKIHRSNNIQAHELARDIFHQT